MAVPGDPQATFRTYANYLEAFYTLLPAEHSAWPFTTLSDILKETKKNIVSTSNFAAVNPKKSGLREDAVSRSLKNAWGTELLLVITPKLIDDDDVRALANNWAAVQAYYCCFHILHALTACQGSTPLSHAGLQRAYSHFWVTSNPALAPWSLGWQSNSWRNLPSGKQVGKISSAWVTCDEESCWSLVGMALRTTRDDLLKERYKEERKRLQRLRQKEWEDQEDMNRAAGKRARTKPAFPLPRIPPTEKQRIDRGLRPTTLLDFLYRLRIRSNYEDPTMFTDGPESPAQTMNVHKNLSYITSATLLAHELFIRQIAGRNWFERQMNEWLNGPGAYLSDLGLQARRDLLLGP